MGFGDVNPPVHAWEAWRVFYKNEGRVRGVAYAADSGKKFFKVVLNFTWWVNRPKIPMARISFGGLWDSK